MAKFIGFSRDDNKSLIINTFKPQGEKNFYWHNDIEDDNLYVEFKSESDLISATNKYIYCKHIKTFRIPRNSTWPVKTQSLEHAATSPFNNYNNIILSQHLPFQRRAREWMAADPALHSLSLLKQGNHMRKGLLTFLTTVL